MDGLALFLTKHTTFCVTSKEYMFYLLQSRHLPTPKVYTNGLVDRCLYKVAETNSKLAWRLVTCHARNETKPT